MLGDERLIDIIQVKSLITENIKIKMEANDGYVTYPFSHRQDLVLFV
jgi:hypothetical protein